MQVEKIYTFGQGHVSCGMGVDRNDFTPCIIISKIEKHEKVGTDLMNKQINYIDPIVLKFNNVKGLNVLKEMVRQVENNLLDKKKK